MIAPVLLAFVFLISCDDNLSPKAPFEKEYVMFGYINADTTFQTVYLSHSYEVEGYDPMANKVDPVLQGADVKLTVNRKKVYNFTPATAARTDTSRYDTPVSYYQLNTYKPADGDSVHIEASLPDGKKLSSDVVVPPVSYLYYETSTVNYSPSNNDGTGVKGIKFGWRFLNVEFNERSNYFYPRLDIVYAKADNPGNKIRVKVPLYFLNNGAVPIPKYPNVSNATSVVFYGDSIEQILNSISAGDPVKSNYIIDYAEFTLLLMDRNMASYLGSENTFSDEFSIRIDAADFTNVNGGLGMFGAAATKRNRVKIDKFYIQSFGYRTTY